VQTYIILILVKLRSSLLLVAYIEDIFNALSMNMEFISRVRQINKNYFENIFTSAEKILKILSYELNKLYFQLQNIEFLFITYLLLLEHVCLKSEIFRAIHNTTP
jgi:hypothetical protein